MNNIRARLGKTIFYVQKPQDCIENELSNFSNEINFIIQGRTNPANTLYGSCSICIEQTYYSRLKLQSGETTFRDTILGRAVTVKQYSKFIDLKNVAKGTQIVREFELATNGSFFWVNCTGYSNFEINKFYNVARSLSR